MESRSRIYEIADGDTLLVRIVRGGCKVIVRPEEDSDVRVETLVSGRPREDTSRPQLNLPTVEIEGFGPLTPSESTALLAARKKLTPETFRLLLSLKPPIVLGETVSRGRESDVPPAPAAPPGAPPAPGTPPPPPEDIDLAPRAYAAREAVPATPQDAPPVPAWAADVTSPLDLTPRSVSIVEATLETPPRPTEALVAFLAEHEERPAPPVVSPPSDILVTYALKDSVANDPARRAAWETATGHAIDPRFPWTVALDTAPDRLPSLTAPLNLDDVATSRQLAPMNTDEALPYDCPFCGMAISRQHAMSTPGGSCGCVPKGATRFRHTDAPYTHTAWMSAVAFDELDAKIKRTLKEPLPGAHVTWTVVSEAAPFDAGRVEAKLRAEEHAAIQKLQQKNRRGLLLLRLEPIPPPLSDAAVALQRAIRNDTRWMRELPDPKADELAALHKGSQCAVYKNAEGWHVYVRSPGESELAFKTLVRTGLPTDAGVIRVREYSRKGTCVWDMADESTYQDTAKAPAKAPHVHPNPPGVVACADELPAPVKPVRETVSSAWWKRSEPEPDRLALKAPGTAPSFCTLGESGWRHEPRGKTETPAAFQTRYERAILDPSIVRVRRYDKRARCVADSFDVFKPLDSLHEYGKTPEKERVSAELPAGLHPTTPSFVLPEVPKEPVAMPVTRVWIREAEWDALDPSVRAGLEIIGDTAVAWDGRVGFITAEVPFGRMFFTLQDRCDAARVVLHRGDAPPKTSTPVVAKGEPTPQEGNGPVSAEAPLKPPVIDDGTSATVPGARPLQFKVVESTWADQRNEFLSHRGQALYNAWKREGGYRVVVVPPGRVQDELCHYVSRYGGAEVTPVVEVPEPIRETAAKPARPVAKTTPKPGAPAVVHRLTEHSEADKRWRSHRQMVVWHRRRDGWHSASRSEGETAPAWKERVATLTKGADLVREYNRAGKCTRDSRDEKGGGS